MSKAERHIAKADLVKVERELDGEDFGLKGFLLNVSANFLLVQIEFDFEIGGYAIVPISTISNIRCNRTDKFQKSILKKEGVIGRDYGIDTQVDLSDWASILKSLKSNGHIVTIEDEAADETVFTIG